MIEPIELLKQELERLRDIVTVKELHEIKAEESIMIPAYENSIKFLERENEFLKTNTCVHHWIEWESNNYIPRNKCLKCGIIK